MKTAEVIEQLYSLKEHCLRMINEDEDIWKKDVQALDHAIKVLKKKDLSSSN